MSDRRPCVYVLRSGGLYKIGWTVDLEARIQPIRMASASQVTVEHVLYTEACDLVEQALHQRFQAQRQHGEWFALTPDDVLWLKAYDPSTESDLDSFRHHPARRDTERHKPRRTFRIDEALYREMERVSGEQEISIAEWLRRTASSAISAHDRLKKSAL